MKAGTDSDLSLQKFSGVEDGARTHDLRNHNPTF